MKQVVSVSLGTNKRNKSYEVEILGEMYKISREGTDGDLQKFSQRFTELDGKVDALGVGGADLFLVVEDKRYTFKEIAQLVAGAKTTPVVDGSGLKHTLEREAVFYLRDQNLVDFEHEKVLLVSGVDRFGMAQALSSVCPNVIFGDFLFALGIPIKIRKYKSLVRLGKFLLPIVTRLPFKWFYPTGEKQEKRTPKFPKVFAECSLIAGDWHYIRRYCPEDMKGKTVLTQTLRSADFEWLRSIGVKRAITTTPSMGGESFATNVMEGVLVAHLGKRPENLTPDDYKRVLQQLDWKPNVVEL